MCTRGEWRSFHMQWISGEPCAIQQCTECLRHRALSLDEVRVVKPSDASDGGIDTENSDDGDFDGW